MLQFWYPLVVTPVCGRVADEPISSTLHPSLGVQALAVKIFASKVPQQQGTRPYWVLETQM
jgi:hypothetical protein